MGGSYVTLAETKNYRWMAYENHSGAYTLYDVRVLRKSDDVELEKRTSSEDDSAYYMEYDEAWKELEQESAQQFQWKKLSEEQTTLAELWKRMTQAESALEYYKRRYEELQSLFTKMDEMRRRT